MAKVTVIPSTIQATAFGGRVIPKKRRVAGYARVSTDSDEQFTSFEAQVDYYTKVINANPDWEFVKVYTDEGISGTNIKNRDGFNEMIKDALNGKIDLIITKSVSRFARNTVDSLATIRKLKEKNVECFFEKEDIYTFDTKGELLTTIMSSLAQEESRSISENVTMGKRWGFQKGKVQMAYKNFLGYQKGPDGRPEIVEEEAAIVRRIYRMFLSGKSYKEISEILESDGIKSPGGSSRWGVNTVVSILQNEKYKGDALLQKTFVTDFLSHKAKKNEGELTQYYVKDSHPYIIPPAEWDFAQLELNRRRTIGRAYNGRDIFACKVYCGDCGGFYGRKVWHSNDKYRAIRYRCNRMFDKGHKQCETPILTEEQIKQAFVTAYNSIKENREQIIEDAYLMIEVIDKQEELEKEIASILEQMEEISVLVKNLIDDNATKPLDQDAYQKKYDSYKKRYDALDEKLKAAQEKKTTNFNKIKGIELFIENIKMSPQSLETWDTTLWIRLVQKAIVHREKTITFTLYSGREIEAKVE